MNEPRPANVICPTCGPIRAECVRHLPKKRQRKKSTKTAIMDRAWSQAIKDRDGHRCQKCGATDDLQAAHVFTRSKRSVRWDLENGVCLCRKHHLYWAHRDVLAFAAWVREWMGTERFEALQQRANKTVKSARKVS